MNNVWHNITNEIGIYFLPRIYSAFYHVNRISAVQWFTFNIFRGFLLSTCISLCGVPFILLVEHRFLSSSSLIFFFSQKLWNFHAINLSSCFGQSFVCLLQAHFHCRSRLYYWLNEISITKKKLHKTRPRSTCNGKKQSATTFLLISWEPFKKT